MPIKIIKHVKAFCFVTFFDEQDCAACVKKGSFKFGSRNVVPDFITDEMRQKYQALWNEADSEESTPSIMKQHSEKEPSVMTEDSETSTPQLEIEEYDKKQGPEKYIHEEEEKPEQHIEEEAEEKEEDSDARLKDLQEFV